MLDWNAVGALGELASALAVVITLLYLSRQLRATARQQRLDSHRAVSEEFNRINDIWLDEKNTGMLVRAWNDWDGATAQEQHLTWLFFTKITNHVQTLFMMWEAGAVDDDVYLAEETLTCMFLVTDGGARWWQMMQAGHAPRFTARINQALASGAHTPITQQMPFWQPDQWPR